MLVFFLLFSCVVAKKKIRCEHPVTSVLRLAPGTDPEAVARRRGYELVALPPLPGNRYEYVVGCADGSESYNKAAKIIDHARKAGAAAPDPEILSETVQQKKQHHPRGGVGGGISAEGYVPTASQWHLAAADVFSAWGRGYFGRGTGIVIVDNGVQGSHPDIVRGFDYQASANFNSGDPRDPSPTGNDCHGTSAAGIAGAWGAQSPPGHGICGQGVAPESTTVGVKLIAEAVTPAKEARAMLVAKAQSDVYSCSWGPADDGATLDGPDDDVRAAIREGATNGRGGLGCLYAWAAGNGRANGDSCAYDGYASDPYVAAVAAVTCVGRAAWYSEACPAVFISAPSSGDGKSIATTDISGRRGASAGDCNSAFGGTSAAAPFAAGVFALIRSVNCNLTKRDVMRIAARTATRVDPADPSWQLNGAGIWHSPRYGFGMVNAGAAVLLAETYAPTPVASDFSEDATKIRRLEGVMAVVTATPVLGKRRGDMRFVLTSPAGSMSVFESRPNDDSFDGYEAWPFYSLAHWGESLASGWTFVETNSAARPGWTWTLHFFGGTG